MFTFVIADIHGRADLLEIALSKIYNYASEGTIITLGDYIDRGPNSKEVVNILMNKVKPEYKLINLSGNHEDFLINRADNRMLGSWLVNGGFQTLESYNHEIPKEHDEWYQNLKIYYEDEHRFYVHAWIKEGVKAEKQYKHDLLWGRFNDKDDYSYLGKHIVHGHTPHKEPELLQNRTNLDTGAYSTGKLVVAVFIDEIPGGPDKIL